jgi:flagellar biogenesis protein FliO
MRWQIVAIGLGFAVVWHTARDAIAQSPGPAPTAIQTPSGMASSGIASGHGMPPQQTAYAAPASPVAQFQTNLPAQLPASALPPPTAPAQDRPASHLLPARKSEANTLRPGARETTTSGRPAGLGSLLTMGASLVLVLGLFLIVAWLLRRVTPSQVAVLPQEVFEILGRAPLASRHQVHMVRCGRKLLLLSVSPAGIETLAEINDPVEVDRLAGLCVQAQPGSASMAFRQVFQQFTSASERGGDVAPRLRESRHG